MSPRGADPLAPFPACAGTSLVSGGLTRAVAAMAV